MYAYVCMEYKHTKQKTKQKRTYVCYMKLIKNEQNKKKKSKIDQ